jgi:trimeric autotransporter adhesin
MGKGNIIGKANEPTTTVASGMWSLREQYAARKGDVWPGQPMTADFTISPAVSGKSSWNLTTDGALNLGTTGEWTIVASRTLTVSAKMWGAGGAPGGSYTASFPPTTGIGDGGGGGYATGTFQLTNGSTYILRVGRGGRRNTIANLNTSGATHLSGGVQTNSQNWGSEGGGYTGIFATSVTQANVWLMAGGGGGGSDSGFGQAGAGGGTDGANSTAGGQGGGGGTQSAGGAAAIFNNSTAGSALTGGRAQNNEGSLGGGGGGYFGGGGGNVGGGGGGSGYFKSGTVSSATLTAGSGSTPGNSADSDRSGSGTGGTGSTNGSDGRARIAFVSAP